jgi:hypothetical protein
MGAKTRTAGILIMAKLKNYTTTIPAFRSIGEIQEILIAFGAQNIILDSPI